MGALTNIVTWLGVALDRVPRLKSALKFTFVLLTLFALSLPFQFPHNPWALAAIVIIVVVDGIGFLIPSTQDRRRSGQRSR